MEGKIIIRWLYIIVLVEVGISPSLSDDSVVLWNNDQAEVIHNTNAGDKAIQIVYDDVTDFVHGLNDWNFIGMWSKYDLSVLDEENKIVPEIPDRKDQSVLICHALPRGSILEKRHPALENGTLVMIYYVAAKKNFSMIGEAVDMISSENRQEIFKFTYPEDLSEHNDTWVMESFKIHNFTNEFMLKFTIAGDIDGIWAVAEIKVHGFKPKSSPIVIPDTTESGDNVTNPVPNINSTGPAITSNVTTGVAVNLTTESSNVTIDVNATTIVSNITSGNETVGNGTDIGVNGTGGTNINGTSTNGINSTSEKPDIGVPGESSSFQENVNKLAGVAQAIWDAFYVFLALFCACLVAIVGLIVRGRCKDDDNPPAAAVATYNPRTASYRLDKVYDNPSFDTNAV